MTKVNFTQNKIPVATVGLGLMGCSIATCILAAGHRVTSLVQTIDESARLRINGFLHELRDAGMLHENPDQVIQRLVITDDINQLARHEIVIESVVENVEVKREIYKNLENVLSSEAIIGSNTSAIPVTILQEGLKHPQRLLGIHWAEPAHITRFMEIICGKESELQYAETVRSLAESWGKEPSILRKDIRGFITNRIMYAMLREAFFLVENGYATVEDVDRSVRNDMGYWMTLAGPFRFMDLTGIPAYLTVMKNLFPELDNAVSAPRSMEKLVADGARGVANAHGFYSYTEESAREWEKRFIDFSYDIRQLAGRYHQTDSEP